MEQKIPLSRKNMEPKHLQVWGDTSGDNYGIIIPGG